jgi:hypothetical protein
MADHHAVTPSRGNRILDRTRRNRPHSRERPGQARLPETVLTVVVIGADAGSLRCHLSAAPAAGVLILTFAPWPPLLVVRCRLAALPAPGRLAVREVRLTTRMGRTVRHLIPAFTAP